MTKTVKWAIGIAAAVGGYLVLKNGGLTLGLQSLGGEDAPGVMAPGDVKYSAYKAAWDSAKSKNEPEFAIDGSLKLTYGQGRTFVFYTYTWQTTDGHLLHKIRRPWSSHK